MWSSSRVCVPCYAICAAEFVPMAKLDVVALIVMLCMVVDTV